MMMLLTKSGAPKVMPECTYPRSAERCVDRVYTDLAAFEIIAEGVRVLETYGTTYHELSKLLDVPVL